LVSSGIDEKKMQPPDAEATGKVPPPPLLDDLHVLAQLLEIGEDFSSSRVSLQHREDAL